MRYPKYTREQDLRCKLTLDDIEYIRRVYKFRIYTYKMIARKLGVHPLTVFYWASKELHKKRLEYAKLLRLKYPMTRNEIKEHRKKYVKKWVKRKKEVMPTFKTYLWKSQWRKMATGERQPYTLTEKYKIGVRIRVKKYRNKCIKEMS